MWVSLQTRCEHSTFHRQAPVVLARSAARHPPHADAQPPPSNLPLGVPHGRHVRTLVLDLDDLLVHSEWTRARGWRTFKRPGAEDFLRQMSQCYELVVYTDTMPSYADPILER